MERPQDITCHYGGFQGNQRAASLASFSEQKGITPNYVRRYWLPHHLCDRHRG
ncbi:hypothetical protein LC612_25660 [Nostoc sp. CHAB 5834]|nr:hypothetical protein [Nostoc sp. CHAB 5834]